MDNNLILIVDDNIDNLKTLSGLLKGTYQLRVSTGGNEAIALAKQEPIPNLILLDIMMPKVDGYTVCRQLKADVITQDIPVIFLTALSQVEDETRGFEAGAVDFISKPFSPPIVLARIRTHLKLSYLITQTRNLAYDTSELLIKESHARARSDEFQRRTQEVKMVILKLLESAMKPCSLLEQLESALNIISTLSWLSIQSKGAVFLAEPDGTLVMMASKNMAEPILAQCARVVSGHCLCGRAAAGREVIFASHVDDRHDILCPGMPDHGHYVLPLLEEDRLIGVIQCHLAPGYEQKEGDAALMAEIANVLEEIISRRMLESRLQVSQFELEDNYREIVRTLGIAAEFRDNDTGLHIVRMGHYSAVLGGSVGLPQNELELLLLTAPMHDVGKIGIPDSILLKAGKLTEDEYTLIKTHTTIGGKILNSNSPTIVTARAIAMSHHEKWDGSGYPYGLKAEEIPLYGRICAIADVFDALTMERPYKQPWPIEKAVDLIKEGAGRHFDPTLVQAFLDCLPKILHIREIYQDGTDSIGKSVFVRPLKTDDKDSPLWSHQFVTGIPRIDDQHRFLFSLVDRLEQAFHQRQAVLEICTALKELESYVFIHFAEEERLMLQCHYEGCAVHKEQHANFEHQVRQSWALVRDNCFLAGRSLIGFLRAWLVNHIMGSDMKLKDLPRDIAEHRHQDLYESNR